MRRSLFVVLCLFVAAAASATVTKEFHKALPLNADGSVSIDTHNGSVVVTAWPQASVDIAAHIEAERDADLAATNVKVSGGGSSVSVASEYPDHNFGGFFFERSPVIFYTIRVPVGARVRVEQHNARTVVTGLRGDLVVRSHNGSVRVHDFGGGADIETHNGNAVVEFVTYPRASRFSTHNGDFEVALPGPARFTVDAAAHGRNAVSSDFPLTMISGRDVLHATVNGGGPELRFQAHNGSLRLRRR